MLIDDQTALIDVLSHPEIYGMKASAVIQVKKTNISVTFMTGSRAYKLKLGVKFPYVDYSTLEKRRAACEKEKALCDVCAPALCLGVEPVCLTEKGYVIGHEKGGEIVDYLLVMHEFPEDMLFELMSDRGDLDRFEMMDSAESIFKMHQAGSVIKTRDAVEIIRGRIEENCTMIRCFVPDVFDAEDVDELERDQINALDKVKDLLKQRQIDGKIRSCHGDLTLRNMAMWNGKVTIFNPIEFNDDLTQIDVLYDFAFLLVDMESKGLRRLASILFNHYMAMSADWEGVPALPLFLSCRAAVNAYVFAEMSTTIKDKYESNLMANRAYEHMVIARRFLNPEKPILVACGGLSGSGKSRIGREAAPFIGNPPGAVILRDDVLRKNMFGMPLEEYLEETAYTPENESKVFDLLCDECRRILATGQSVVADALFHDPEQRIKIEELAKEMGADFQGLWVDAPIEIRKQRVLSRMRNPSDVKKPEELERQLTKDVGPITWDQIDTSGDRMVTLSQVRSLLSKR